MTPRRISISLILFFLLLLLIASGLASCSTSSRLKTSVQRTSDSTAATTQTAAVNTSTDSISLKTVDSSFTEEITFNLHPAQPDSSSVQIWANGSADDYIADRPAKKKKKAFTYIMAGHVLETDQPVSSVTIKTKGQVQKRDSTHVTTKDSSSVSKAETVQVKKLETQTSVAKKTVRIFSYWWILVLVAAAAGVYYVYRKGFFI